MSLKPLRPVWALLAAVAAALLASAGCGSDSKEKSKAGDDSEPHGRITVSYDPPSDADAAAARQLLKLGGTDGVAAGFTLSQERLNSCPAEYRQKVKSVEGALRKHVRS